MTFKLSYRMFHVFVQTLCVVVAIALACLCVHKYFLDDDLAEINFQTFNDKEHAIYPSITLCFMGPDIFLKDELKRFGKSISQSKYSNFLQGVVWDETMRDIDFDDVTIDIKDYLEGVIISSAGDNARHCSPNFQKILNHFQVPGCINSTDPDDFPPETFQFYVSYRDYHTKCFSMDVPFKKGSKLNRLRLFIRNKIFPVQVNEQYVFEKNFGVFLHYPRQLFRSPIRKLYQNVQNGSLLKVMKFKMQNVEVLIRRNKPSRKCNQNWKKDDDRILSKIVRAIGCEPPHWKLDSDDDVNKNKANITRCSDMRKMQLFSRHSPLAYLVPNINFLNNLPPPCHDVTQSLYEYKEDAWSTEEFKGLDVEANFFEVNLAFPSSVYKEIVQIRAYGLQSLVGYIGGYIGMFLGIGLSQLPSLLMKLYKRMKKSKPKLEGTFRRYTIKRRESGCYKNASVVLKKKQSTTCQQVLECSSSMSNGTDGQFESFHFKDMSNSLLKPRKDVNGCPAVKENKIQTREVLQLRISRLEERLDYVCKSIDDHVENDIEVA